MLTLNSEAKIFVGKEGDTFVPELKINNTTINKNGGEFFINLADYEGQTLEGKIVDKVFYLDGEKIVKYDNLFQDIILDAYVENGVCSICLGDIILDSFNSDLNLHHYKVNVKNDDSYVVVRYANLHQHTENSLLDGIVKVKDLAKKSEYACAITDHGNMFGWYDMLTEFNKLGKKALIGEEFYLETLGGPRLTYNTSNEENLDEIMFDNSRIQNEEGLNGEHLIVIAKNNKGVKNLFKLSSEASNHFNRRPHITFKLLDKYKEGLIVCSACIGSGLNQFIKEYLKCAQIDSIKEWIEAYGEDFYNFPEYQAVENSVEEVYVYNHKKSREYIDWFKEKFGEDFYLEYQDHNFELEKIIMNEMVRIRDEEYPDIKIVATCDGHYLDKEDSYVHELWLCNQTQKTIYDEKRMRFSGEGYYTHTSEEMLNLFPVEYLDNTLEVMDKVQYEPLEDGYHLPHFPLPKGFDSEVEYFKHCCREGFKEKFRNTPHYKDRVYLDRMCEEIDTIVGMGWASYFLIVSDFIKWAEDTEVAKHPEIYFPHIPVNEIPEEFLKNYSIYVGTARGSGAGCLVNFVLGITKIDPLKYDLKFER